MVTFKLANHPVSVAGVTTAWNPRINWRSVKSLKYFNVCVRLAWIFEASKYKHPFFMAQVRAS